MRDYCERKGFVVDTFISVSESASGKKARTYFAEMIRYASDTSNGITEIVAEKVDRLARNKKEATMLEDWVDADESRSIHCAKQSLVKHKHSASSDTLIWDFFVIIASNYSKNLAEEIAKGQNQAAENGFFPGSRKPGYIAAGGHGKSCEKTPRAIDSITSPKILEIFTSIANGESAASVFRRVKSGELLFLPRVPARSYFYKFIRDPFAAGVVRWRGKEYQGKHEAIVPPAIFWKAQKMLDGSTRKKETKNDYLFRGMITDKATGKTLSGMTVKGRHKYYFIKGCYLSEKKILQELEHWFSKKVMTEKGINAIAQAGILFVNGLNEDFEKEKAVLLARESAIKNRIESLVDKLLDDLIGKKEYLERRKKLENDLAEISQKRTAQAPKQKSLELVMDMLSTLKNLNKMILKVDDDMKKRMFNFLQLELFVESGNIYFKVSPLIDEVLFGLKSNFGARERT